MSSRPACFLCAARSLACKSGKRACERDSHPAFPPGNETLLNRVQRWRSRFSNKTVRRSMGTPFLEFENRMAGCFSFRKRWRAVNKAGQMTCARLAFLGEDGPGRSLGLPGERGAPDDHAERQCRHPAHARLEMVECASDKPGLDALALAGAEARIFRNSHENRRAVL